MTHLILMALAPIFFVMALGFFAGRRHVVDNLHVGTLNTLVMSFAVPASMFVAIGSAPRAEMMRQGGLFVVEGAAMLAVYLLWYFWERRGLGTARGESATQALTVAFPNIAGVGLPLVSAVLGPAGAVPAAIGLAAGSILVTPLTLLLLELPADKEAGSGRSSGRVLRALCQSLAKPLVVAPVLGLVLSLSGWGLDAVAAASLHLIGAVGGGLALFVTGLVLSAQSLRLDWKVAGATLAGCVVRPLLVFAIVRAAHVPPDTAKVAILLATTPSGFFGLLLGLSHKQESAEVGSMLIAATLFSIVSLSVAIAVLYPR
jgi:malonate transporter